MGFKMCRINLQLVRSVLLRGQSYKNPLKYAHVTPADETVIQGLVWTVLFRGIPPLRTPLQNMNDPTDNL
uniref:Uncharacterized protein n=1 Tax=Candidatus Kentrum sp. LFY TaxID=2126342 RepID=A0A450WG23_9GAMM|nr:MAG: hypothetical protein BECKLFY1418C_GA0070996_10205 [Candidatus Kentron sp. LFY]